MSTRRQRERRLAIGLAAVLAVLLAGIVLTVATDRRRSGGGAGAVARDAVSRVAIERPGRADIVLERIGEDWRVTAPCPLDANDARVTPLLDALGGGALDYPAQEVDLAAASLLDPSAVVRLDDTATSLGGTDLGGGRRYALRDGRVAFVPEWTLSLVEGGLSAFAEPRPLPEPPTSLRRLDSAARDDVAGSPDPSPAPSADSPDSPSDGSALDPAPWGALTANQLVPWPVPDAPPTTRRARLEARLASGETRLLELSGNASWNALRVDGSDCAYLFADDDLPPDAYP